MVDVYTILALSTQRFRDRGCSDLVPSAVVSNVCDATTDLDEPDREIVAIRVAARHSELLGALLGEAVSQVTCHLNRAIDDARALYSPISEAQALQVIRRGSTGSAPSMASLLVSKVDSELGRENCWW
jgi:hypothetical protein